MAASTVLKFASGKRRIQLLAPSQTITTSGKIKFNIQDDYSNLENWQLLNNNTVQITNTDKILVSYRIGCVQDVKLTSSNIGATAFLNFVKDGEVQATDYTMSIFVDAYYSGAYCLSGNASTVYNLDFDSIYKLSIDLNVYNGRVSDWGLYTSLSIVEL